MGEIIHKSEVQVNMADIRQYSSNWLIRRGIGRNVTSVSNAYRIAKEIIVRVVATGNIKKTEFAARKGGSS